MDGLDLTKLLEQAADGEEAAMQRFFEGLLSGSLFVVMRVGFNRDSVNRAPVIGQSHLATLGLLTVQYEGVEALPIFTEESFAQTWTEAEVSVERRDFKTLLNLVGDSWMYLNPGQEVGKEITNWEIEQLRRGPDAIPDLVRELIEGEMGPSFEVRSGQEYFPGFVEKLNSVFELAPELEEAYFAAMFEDDSQSPIPTLGLKYRSIKAEKRGYLREELKQVSEDLLPQHTQLFLVDDLEHKQSPNWRLFEEVQPFYRSTAAVARQTAKPSIVGRVRSLFVRK
jgi:hypothetical protein